MSESVGAQALIAREDLRVVAAVTGARFPEPDCESLRLALVRRFVNAALELDRVTTAHARRVLVDHRGTPGSVDLGAATDLLFDALVEYAASIHELVSQYGPRGQPGSMASKGLPDAAEPRTRLSLL